MFIDVFIVSLILIICLINWSTNFSKQYYELFSGIGLLLGLLLGRYLIMPHTINLVHSYSSRVLATILTIIISGILMAYIFEGIALRIKIPLDKSGRKYFARVIGVIITVTAILGFFWLANGFIIRQPSSSLARQFSASRIIGAVNNLLPQSQNALREIGRLISPNGSPIVFSGIEPLPSQNINLPSLGSMAGAVTADKNSVVRIHGLGCGGIVSGSGFVVKPGIIATNAHVVAGIRHHVLDNASGSYNAELILFDPSTDLAILKTTGLNSPALRIDTNHKSPGTPGVFLGYPGGGSLQASQAVILQDIIASGRDIYNQNLTIRSVYTIKGNVQEGDSGGPLIESNGSVMGIIFAESTSYDQVGYSLAIDKILSEINSVNSNSPTINSTRCTT